MDWRWVCWLGKPRGGSTADLLASDSGQPSTGKIWLFGVPANKSRLAPASCLIKALSDKVVETWNGEEGARGAGVKMNAQGKVQPSFPSISLQEDFAQGAATLAGRV